MDDKSCIRVLLVNDDPKESREFRQSLEKENFQVHELLDGKIDEHTIHPNFIDIIIIRLSSTHGKGLQPFSYLPINLRELPILVMTDSAHEELAAEAVHHGAQEAWVIGEVSDKGVGRLIRHAIERHSSRTRLYNLCMIDDLTGLYNRRGFLVHASEQMIVNKRRGGFCLSILDLDGLKHINDTRGHLEGDRAIIRVANFLKKAFRKTDILARLGGDEFAVLTVESAKDLTRQRLVRLQKIVADYNRSNKSAFPLSLSAGVLYFKSENSIPLEELLHRADKAMYSHKKVNHRTPGEKPYVFDERPTTVEDFQVASL